MISLVVHAFAFALLFAGLNQPHRADLRSDVQRYAVRIMELHRPEPKEQKLARSGGTDPGHAAAASHESGGGQESAAAARIPLNFLSQQKAVQTLIQPDVQRNVVIPQEAPLPQVLQWSPPDPAISKIVLPTPQIVVQIKVQPTLDLPNQEMRVSDVRLSASAFSTKAPLPVPSKTSPVNVQAPEQGQRVPETASKSSGPPTPASIISVSEIKLQDGTATLPMISEVAPTPFSGSLTPGQPKSSSETGNGKTDSKLNGAGAGPTSGNRTGTAVASTNGPVGQGGVGQNGVGQGGVGQGGMNGLSGPGSGGGSDTTEFKVVHIALPKNGTFGVVVVGSSVAEDYPETVDLWKGRLAYTVYLHVGITKNWIMQYSLPRSQAVTYGASRPDAPWPYDITRPSIDPDVNADAIMVHGFVNTAGRFEQLAIIFPTALNEAKFLLHALQQWQFRPAMQNGQATAMEVLLIIPADAE